MVRQAVVTGKVDLIALNTNDSKTLMPFDADRAKYVFQYWDRERNKPLRSAFGRDTLLMDESGKIITRTGAYVRQDEVFKTLQRKIFGNRFDLG